MSSACHFFIDHCYNTGEITGYNESAAISGWIGDASSITNSYNAGYVVGVDGSKTFARFGSNPTFSNCFDVMGQQESIGSFDEEDAESGALAYYLNGKSTDNPTWFQTLGVDYFPVPFASHGIVYPAGSVNCDGSPKDDFHFSNEEGELTQDEHEYENGICINCGIAQEGYLPIGEDGLYHIFDGEQLLTYSGIVQLDGTASAVLEDDIELSGVEWRPIGTVASPFKGTFDGQNHYIDNMIAEGDEYVGLFGVIADGADIRNLSVVSSAAPTAVVPSTSPTSVTKLALRLPSRMLPVSSVSAWVAHAPSSSRTATTWVKLSAHVRVQPSAAGSAQLPNFATASTPALSAVLMTTA